MIVAKAFIHSLIHAGLDEHDESMVARQIRVVNQISIFLFLPAIVHFTLFAYFGSPILATIALSVAVTFSVTLYLNSKLKFEAAKILALVMIDFYLFVFPLLLGKDAGVQFYAFFLIGFSFTLTYDKSHKPLYRVFQLIPFILLFVAEQDWITSTALLDIDPKLKYFSRYMVFVLALLSNFWFIRSLYLGNVRAERAIEVQHHRSAQERNLSFQNAKMASLGQMAGGLAHEINNPLLIISGKASMVGDLLKAEPLDLARVDSHLDKIEATVGRISKIVRGLLSFSSVELAGHRGIHKVETIFGDAVSLCSAKIEQCGVKVRFEDWGKGAVEVEGHGGDVAQILISLIQNSCDAISNLPDRWILVQTDRLDGQARIRITDSGKGIPSNIADRIMEPFFTTKDVGKGIGLGLSLSLSLAQKHGGNLVYDRDFPNTSFVLTLPLVHSSGQTAA